jgi:hypothetical protein
MHLEKVTGKNVMKTYNRAPEKGWPLLFQNILIFGICIERGFFNIHHDHIQWKQILGQGLKFEVVFRIGFLTQKFETTKYMKLNKEKWDSQNETRKKLRNKMKFYFWRNKTKQNEISLLILFRETSKILRNNFLFRFVLCFAKQKKDAKWKP